MLHTRTFLLANSLLLACAVAATAQNKRPREAASDFNIELINLDDRTHIFSIPEPPARAGYIAHVNLKRIPEWKTSEAVPAQTSALRIQFWLEEGLPKIEVTAVLGKIEPHSRPYEWSKLPTALVASRSLQPDQIASIQEAERFGITPFQVKVSRAQPWSVGPPQIINKTQALTILRLTEARPHYTLQLRNVSHKTINGIRWYGEENGRRHGGSGISGASLIPAGRPFEIRQRFGFTEEQRDAGASTAETPVRTVVIAAIVFDDGTFEGLADEAAEMAANMSGEHIQLERINALVQALSSPSDPEQLKKLKQVVNELSEAVDPDVTAELRTRFATASEDMRMRRIKEEVANGLRSTKHNVLREIEKLEFRLASGDKADFQRGLRDFLETLGKVTTN